VHLKSILRPISPLNTFHVHTVSIMIRPLKRFLPLFSLFLASALPGNAPYSIQVSATADDGGDGSPAAPYNSIVTALREARELRRLGDDRIRDGVNVLLADGTYPLQEPLLLRWEDSGTAESPTVIAAADGARPVLSGGVPITGWQPVKEAMPGLPDVARGQVLSAPAPMVGGRPLFFRDLWVGGQRAQRAWSSDGESFRRILAWDKERQICWIPADALSGLGDDPQGLELVIHQMWAIAILRVKEFTVHGDRAAVRFHEPENRVQFEHPWPPVVINEEHGNSIFYLANRLAFLDSPGEWYQDPYTGRVTYWPREPGELDRKAAIAPHLETLVRFEGSPGKPVEHVGFEGIAFRHTTWMRPSEAGHVPLQAGFYMYEAYKLKTPGTPDKASLENQAWVGRKPAGVELRHARGAFFRGCAFTAMAASGLDLVVGVKDASVTGSLFRDIGGSGFVAGAFQEEGVETHVPYIPENDGLICENIVFANNRVTDIANQDWGCVGVLVGYARDVEVAHNEISHLAYTGISVGWGWTQTESPALRDNRIHANHIHQYGQRVYDTAGIYTLNAQPGTRITGNAIHSIARPSYVHDPYHWSYIYLDEGSSYITVADNWTERIKFSTNATGPGNVWRNTGPDAVDVRAKAGLQPGFEHLLDPSHEEVR
jgi:hypothetical protein